MKNIILGSNGMAGHLISNELESNDKFMVTRVAARTNSDFNIDFRDSLKLESLKYLLNKADVVINCVGLLINKVKKI